MDTRLKIASLGALLAALVLSGCASTPTPSAVQCLSLNCMQTQAREAVAKQCRTDLFWVDNRNRAFKKRVQATYGYPLKSSDNYNELLRMGFKGPSPDDWCRRFAEMNVQLLSSPTPAGQS